MTKATDLLAKYEARAAAFPNDPDYQRTVDVLRELIDPWVSVKERLPDDSEMILLCHWAVTQDEPQGDFLWIASGFVEGMAWYCDFTDDEFIPKCYNTVTHWMPLPSPPTNPTGDSDGT